MRPTVASGIAAAGITATGTATGTTAGTIGRWVGGRQATGAARISAIPWSWGYWPYYNPYCVGPVVDNGVSINYAQPIVVAQPIAAPPDAPTGVTAEDQAAPLFDAARNAFMQGDYQTALAQVDQAIALVPNDTLLHEFRGLASLPWAL